jgi:hypothetical protein
MSHMLMMILCCGLPLLLLLLIPTIGRFIPGSAGFLGSIVPFLCPLMMIAMIPMMIKSFKSNKGDKQIDAAKPEDGKQAGSCHSS